jgi:hypothetical protein
MQFEDELMSELGDKRKSFTKYVSRLISFMISQGYQPMIGKDGLKHMKNSLHYEGLAVDIDLCDSKGNYISSAHPKMFGDYWKSLNPDCAWGGDFNDSNHYSIKFGGRK